MSDRTIRMVRRSRIDVFLGRLTYLVIICVLLVVGLGFLDTWLLDNQLANRIKAELLVGETVVTVQDPGPAVATPMPWPTQAQMVPEPQQPRVYEQQPVQVVPEPRQPAVIPTVAPPIIRNIAPTWPATAVPVVTIEYDNGARAGGSRTSVGVKPTQAPKSKP